MKKFKSMTKAELREYMIDMICSLMNVALHHNKFMEDKDVPEAVKRGVRGCSILFNGSILAVMNDMKEKDLLTERLDPLHQSLLAEEEAAKEMVRKHKQENTHVK